MERKGNSRGFFSDSLARLHLLPAAGLLILLFFYYWQFRHSFFIYDDLSLLATFYLEADRFADALKPFNNGFWRPTANLPIYLLAQYVAVEPIVFRLVSWLTVLATAFAAGRLLHRWGRMQQRELGQLAMLAALMILAHNLTWYVAVPWHNINDVLYTLFLVLGMHCWLSWIDGRRRVWYVAALCCYLLALLSKETAVIFWMGLAFYEAARSTSGTWRGKFRSLLPVLPFFAAACLWFMLAAYFQISRENSYLNNGQGNFHLLLYKHTYVRYLFAIAYPFDSFSFIGHWARPTFPNLLFAMQVAFFVGIILMIKRSVQNRWPFHAEISTSLLLSLLLCLPAGLIVFGYDGRYLFGPLVFLTLGLVAASSLLRYRSLVIGALWIFVFLHAGSLWMTENYQRYAAETEAVARFVPLAQDESIFWRDGQTIYIKDAPHPDPGSQQLHWIYNQLLINLILPQRELHFASDDFSPEAQRYHFDGYRLLRLD